MMMIQITIVIHMVNIILIDMIAKTAKMIAMVIKIGTSSIFCILTLGSPWLPAVSPTKSRIESVTFQTMIESITLQNQDWVGHLAKHQLLQCPRVVTNKVTFQIMFNIIITDIIVISDVNDIGFKGGKGDGMLLGVYGSLNVFPHTVFVQTVFSKLYYSQLYPAYPSINLPSFPSYQYSPSSFRPY